MSGFTKLVPEIIRSSIWNETAEIRCVWIAMIATKDENGYVRGDARTIARMANVSMESATTALDLFQQPDPSSHTPDNEGRRIMPAPGGWIILNHGIYRARDDVYREKARERVRRFRQKMEGADADVTLQETQQKRNRSASVSVSESASQEREMQEGESRWTIEDVIATGEKPTVALTPSMATAYFDWRNKTGWVDAKLRPVATTKSELQSDMRHFKTHVYPALQAEKETKSGSRKSDLINTWHDPNPDETMRKAF